MSSKTSGPTDPDDLADVILVERFQETGDMQYIERLWHKYAREVYQRCLQFLRNGAAAEDATVEVFVKVMGSLRSHYLPIYFDACARCGVASSRGVAPIRCTIPRPPSTT
ncbi:hypothetical protein SBA3_2940006 [Candidatus Sulfopaludibacter sp. SbA3]|nr:hypothetical protein SBA3_2940006 [Candidatus Sulfopaludibacter sp. SbA3]